MRCVAGTNWAFVYLAIPPKVPPVTGLGFFKRIPESRIEPVQDMNRIVGETDQSEIKAFLSSVYAGCRASFWRPCRVGRVKT